MSISVLTNYTKDIFKQEQIWVNCHSSTLFIIELSNQIKSTQLERSLNSSWRFLRRNCAYYLHNIQLKLHVYIYIHTVHSLIYIHTVHSLIYIHTVHSLQRITVIVTIFDAAPSLRGQCKLLQYQQTPAPVLLMTYFMSHLFPIANLIEENTKTQVN